MVTFFLINANKEHQNRKRNSKSCNPVIKCYKLLINNHDVFIAWPLWQLWRGTWGFAVSWCWCFFDAVNKITTCGVAVISNLTLCDVCVFHAAVFGEMKLFAVLGFLIYLSRTQILPKFSSNMLQLPIRSCFHLYATWQVTRPLPPGAQCSVDTWRSEDRNNLFILWKNVEV